MSAVTNIAEMECLADLIRRDHPSLKALSLRPDGKYQSRRMAADQVTDAVRACLSAAFRDRAPEDFPRLYCAWGKARVGSTALNNLFGLSGLPSYYQPTKAILRCALAQAPLVAWQPPSASEHPALFSKETAGPYLVAECLYNPIQLLIEAGYPADRLHLILLDREPTASLSSWFAKWSDRVPAPTLATHYVLATLNIWRIRNFARRHGVPVTHYVYEASRDPATSVAALFRRLGLADRFDPGILTDWQGIDRLDAAESRILFPGEPAVFEVPGLHASTAAYRYRSRPASTEVDAYAELLHRTGVHDTYLHSVERCAADLALAPDTAARLFGHGLPWLSAAA